MAQGHWILGDCHVFYKSPEIHIMKLTTKEQQLLDSIIEGMDQPGCGWLHELNPFMNDRVCAGVLSQLITKNLVHSYQDEESPNCYWIELVI